MRQVRITNGTVFEASEDGPTVEITENLTLDSPYNYPDAHTVDLAPNASFESDSATNVTVDSIDGEWTNVTIHDVAAGLTVDPTDKQAITIESDAISTVAFRDVDPASGQVDLTYDADGTVEMTIENLQADATVYAIDPTESERLDNATADGTGTASLALSADDDRRVDVRTVGAPIVDNASATPVDETVGPTPTLELGVASVAFPYDRLEANVTLDGEPIANQTLTENGTVTTAPEDLERGGSYTWNVTITDSFGHEVDSEEFNFSISTPVSSGGSSGTSASAGGDVRSVRTQGGDVSATVDVRETSGVATSSLDVTAGADSTVDLEFENDNSAGETTLQDLEMQTGSTIDGELTIQQGTSAVAVGDENAEPLETTIDAEPAAYLSVETDFDEVVKSATFDMSVPAERFDDQEAASAVVYYYVDGEWEPLETTLVDDSGNSYIFVATLDGFSTFAVGINSVEDTKTANTTTEPTTETNTTTNTTREETPGFGIVGAVLAMLTLTLAARPDGIC